MPEPDPVATNAGTSGLARRGLDKSVLWTGRFPDAELLC